MPYTSFMYPNPNPAVRWVAPRYSYLSTSRLAHLCIGLPEIPRPLRLNSFLIPQYLPYRVLPETIATCLLIICRDSETRYGKSRPLGLNSTNTDQYTCTAICDTKYSLEFLTGLCRELQPCADSALHCALRNMRWDCIHVAPATVTC